MAEKIDISVVVLNYNTKEMLRQCLSSVYKSKLGSYHFEVIVIDNASTDGSVSMVKNHFPQVKVVVNKRNIGFAAGNNKGIKKALGRYLLLLNPDTVVPPDTFKTMISFMDKHSKVGAATCEVKLPNGKLDDACHRGFPTPWNAFAYFSGLAKIFPRTKFFTGYTLTYLPLNEVHEIDSGVGAFLLIRRRAGEEINWLDEDYFWYGEDLDFCYRLKQGGWKIMFVPKTKIIHYKGVSSGMKKHTRKMTTADKETRLRAAKASTEVMRIFFKKHYQDKYPRLIYWLVMKGIDTLEKFRLLKYSV